MYQSTNISKLWNAHKRNHSCSGKNKIWTRKKRAFSYVTVIRLIYIMKKTAVNCRSDLLSFMLSMITDTHIASRLLL